MASLDANPGHAVPDILDMTAFSRAAKAVITR
jgi:hypothetical protein